MKESVSVFMQRGDRAQKEAGEWADPAFRNAGSCDRLDQDLLVRHSAATTQMKDMWSVTCYFFK